MLFAVIGQYRVQRRHGWLEPFHADNRGSLKAGQNCLESLWSLRVPDAHIMGQEPA